MNIFRFFAAGHRIRGLGCHHAPAAMFLTAMALFTTAPSYPAHASENPDAPYIEIPFDPPTDAPLRYRLVNERIADGKTRTGILDQELRYRPTQDGYELTITTLSMSDGDHVITPQTVVDNPATAEMLAMLAPVTIALDADGAALHIVDWNAHRQRLARIPRLMSELDPANAGEDGEKAVERMIAPFVAASAEDAVDLLIKHWPTVIGWGGTMLSAGEEYEYSGEVQSPLVPVTLVQESTLILGATATGDISLSVLEETESGAILEAMLSYFEKLGSADDPRHQAMMSRLATEMADARNTNRVEIVFRAGTGTIQSARIEREFEFAIGAGLERTTIDLVE